MKYLILSLMFLTACGKESSPTFCNMVPTITPKPREIQIIKDCEYLSSNENSDIYKCNVMTSFLHYSSCLVFIYSDGSRSQDCSRDTI